MPESSAIAIRPVFAAAVRAFGSALSTKVEPSSGGSSMSAGRGLTVIPAGSSSRANSRSLWALRVASSKSRASETAERESACRGRHRLLLEEAQLLDPGGGEGQQLVQVGARERR